MSSVLELTTFDQIRGVLTVSSADLPDSVLLAYSLEDDLQVDMERWLSEWQAVRDGTEARQKTLLRLYAKYRCAALVAASGQNFTLQRFTDGSNEGQRSDIEGFQLLRAHMESRAASYREELEGVLSTSLSSEPVAIMGVASPNRNPVTEGRS